MNQKRTPENDPSDMSLPSVKPGEGFDIELNRGTMLVFPDGKPYERKIDSIDDTRPQNWDPLPALSCRRIHDLDRRPHPKVKTDEPDTELSDDVNMDGDTMRTFENLRKHILCQP